MLDDAIKRLPPERDYTAMSTREMFEYYQQLSRPARRRCADPAQPAFQG